MNSSIKASIIIPAYNSEKTIENCLNSLVVQNFGQDFEIIVVDDGSKDCTVQIVKKFISKNKRKNKRIEIKLLELPHVGPAFARNSGAKSARGEIVVFTDSDCEAERNWLKEMLSPFFDEKVVGVQGAYKTKQISLIARFIQLEIEERYNRMNKADCLDWIGSYSAAYRKEIYLKEGGFDTNFKIASGEDPDFSYRLSEKGYKLVFNPKAIVFHTHVDSLKKYLKKKFWHAFWRVVLYSKHKQKIIKDSYTPQELKLQLVSISVFLISIIFLWLSKLFYYLAITSFIVSIILMLKTAKFMFEKDKKIGLITIPILFLRDFAMVSGLAFGILNKLSKDSN